VFLLIMVILSN